MNLAVDINKTCSFTGHRSIPNDVSDYLIQRIVDGILYLYAHDVKTFLTGGAIGFDTLAAKAVIQCRNEHKDIRLILVIPCQGQTKAWKQSDIETYDQIKSLSDKVVCLSPRYYNGCMHERNRCLVNNSSFCICYLTHSSGGTAYTVGYAKSKGLTVFNLAHSVKKP